MNLLEAFFLYAPLPYWLIFTLVLNRHDLSRVLHPIRDDGSPRSWWMVLNHLGLFDKGKVPKKPRRNRLLPLLIVAIASTATSLSWSLRLFPPLWYYLIIAQGISAIILTAATMQYLGVPPRRPFVDALMYPRLGSRIRHLGKVPEGTRPSETDAGDSNATQEATN
jgi:hypothetical protein